MTLLDPVTTGLVAAGPDSLCAVTANPYTTTIITTAPPGAQLTGVPVVAMAAGEYGWFQTRGPASVLTDGVLYIFQQVKPGTVAGSVAHANQAVRTGSTVIAACVNGAIMEDSAGAALVVRASDTATTEIFDIGSLATIVGRVMRVEVGGDYSLIDLTLE